MRLSDKAQALLGAFISKWIVPYHPKGIHIFMEDIDALLAQVRADALGDCIAAIRRGCTACEGSGIMPGCHPEDPTECEYCGRPMEAVRALKEPPVEALRQEEDGR